MTIRLSVKILCFSLLLFTSVFKVCAQLNFDFQEGKKMLKGTVVDIHTKKPLPLAAIRVTTTGKSYSCNNEGEFVMYVSPNDTLRFSSVGYIPKVIHVRNIDSTKFYLFTVELIHDFIKIKEVVIYPYRNVDEFKDAFVNAKDVNKVNIPGIEPPKYSNKVPKAKFYNPISMIYEKVRRKRAANPDFKP